MGGARWKNINRTFDSHAETTTWQTNQPQKIRKKLVNKSTIQQLNQEVTTYTSKSNQINRLTKRQPAAKNVNIKSRD